MMKPIVRFRRSIWRLSSRSRFCVTKARSASFLGKKDDAEKRKLYKRGAQMRKAAQEPERGPKHRPDWSNFGDFDGDERPETHQKRRRRRDRYATSPSPGPKSPNIRNGNHPKSLQL